MRRLLDGRHSKYPCAAPHNDWNTAPASRIKALAFSGSSASVTANPNSPPNRMLSQSFRPIRFEDSLR